MRGVKKWGIKVNGQWIEHENKPSIYYLRREATEDAEDFNSMRTRGDNPYTVEEYKK